MFCRSLARARSLGGQSASQRHLAGIEPSELLGNIACDRRHQRTRSVLFYAVRFRGCDIWVRERDLQLGYVSEGVRTACCHADQHLRPANDDSYSCRGYMGDEAPRYSTRTPLDACKASPLCERGVFCCCYGGIRIEMVGGRDLGASPDARRLPLLGRSNLAPSSAGGWRGCTPP